MNMHTPICVSRVLLEKGSVSTSVSITSVKGALDSFPCMMSACVVYTTRSKCSKFIVVRNATGALTMMALYKLVLGPFINHAGRSGSYLPCHNNCTTADELTARNQPSLLLLYAPQQTDQRWACYASIALSDKKPSQLSYDDTESWSRHVYFRVAK